MHPARRRQVNDLVDAALSRRDARDRAAFVEAACGQDAGLRREVEARLAHTQTAEAFLSTPVGAAAADVIADASGSLTGRQVGIYRILSPLGAGGMGEVYRARDTRLGRDIALKILPSAFTNDPERLARFEREARMLAALNHPHIGAIYGLEDVNGVPALVLELVEGETLAERIRRGPIPLQDVLGIARQIAEALDAAHEKGIIHRDLKPTNVKITPSGVVKVLDFGLAKIAGSLSADAPTINLDDTREGQILGTAAYMSPEQARGQAVDKRTDLWAFGCVLWEMLVGRAPFARGTFTDTLAAIVEQQPDWSKLPGTTPTSIRHLLAHCLEKNPQRRLRDIGDAVLELDDRASPTAPATDAIQAPPPTNRAILRSRLFRRSAAGALAMLVIIAAVFVVQGNRESPPPTFRQLTFRHGSLRGARLATDGQTVVYSAAWIGAPAETYIIRPESPQSGSMGLADTGIFSVSSRGVLALALGCRLNWGECVGTLAQVPITGGAPREMVKDVQVADWAPDGETMAVVSFAGGRYRLEYPIGKVLYEPEGWITSARVSPGGGRIAFLDHRRLGDLGGSVAVLDSEGVKTVLSSDWKSLQGLAWVGTGDEIWFTGSRTGKGGSSALYAVTLSGRERTVFSSPGTLKLNDISRDGRHVLLTRGTTRGGIIARSAEAGNDRELSWFDYSTVADLSPDGNTLLFYEWGEGVGGTPTIFIRKTDGSDAVRLGEGRPLALSPDGQWALAVLENASQQLMLLPTRTGDVRHLPRGQIIEYLDWATWSPDGRRVFFAGREAPDIRRTYVQDVDGGDPRPVTPDGFVGLLLSPDGRTVAAVDRYGEYYLSSLEGNVDPRPVAGYRDGDALLQWSADGRFLFVREAGNLVLRIHRLDLSTGVRQFWKELVPPDPTVLIDIASDPGQVRIAADGKSYAYTYWAFGGELYLAQGLK